MPIAWTMHPRPTVLKMLPTNPMKKISKSKCRTSERMISAILRKKATVPMTPKERLNDSKPLSTIRCLFSMLLAENPKGSTSPRDTGIQAGTLKSRGALLSTTTSFSLNILDMLMAIVQIVKQIIPIKCFEVSFWLFNK